jgi:hypothetical protein
LILARTRKFGEKDEELGRKLESFFLFLSWGSAEVKRREKE